MKKRIQRYTTLSIALLLLLGGACWNGEGTRHTYYVSASTGDDANDGRSARRPWQSLEKVNTTVFAPGDRILFCSGDRWQGHLHPQGSGAEGRPIRIDRYGDGPLPCIDAEDREGSVVLLENQEYWEITHLEITAGATVDNLDPNKKEIVQGIRVIATSADHVLRHIVISDCFVHDVYSRMKIYEGGGIWVGVPGWSDRPGGRQGAEAPYGYPPTFVTSFDGVLIENNRIEGVDRCGILVWTTAGPGANSQFLPGLIPSKNVVVRGNTLEDVGGDAILIMGSDAPLVERNVVRRACKKAGHPDLKEHGYWAYCAASIWFHHCYRGIIQHNAVYDSYRWEYNFDGMSYDFDYNCEQCLLQYNYSRNNRGGFLLLMGTAIDNIIRYNISENDHTHILFLVGTKEENNQVYNNTFYIDSDTTCIVTRAHLTNNIFMADGTGSIEIRSWQHPFYTPWVPEEGMLYNNVYAGQCTAPLQDSLRATADPQFVAPGQGGEEAANLAGYALAPTSPYRGVGVIVANNGGRDILGRSVPSSGRPDLGAIQQRK
jgi:hypothetical protein